MGNSQSTEHKPTSSVPASPASTISSKQQTARRKESTQTLSSTTSKSSNVPPTATLISASSTASAPQPTKATAHASVTPSPASSHTRARSITAPLPPHLKPDESTEGAKSGSSVDGHRPASRSSTVPIPHPHATPPDSKPAASPSSRPVDVPSNNSSAQHAEAQDLIASGPRDDDSAYGHITSTYSRPPRLPLPIEEEIHTPGSPIISPEEVAIDDKDVDETLPRRTSVLSSTTADDEEIADNGGFYASDDSSAPTVPTPIEWRGGGHKIFVTGTFVNWEKKFKLHRKKDSGYFSTTLQLKPGTHHIKFLVDDDMITSPDLPTTVDFTNILVNYIEIVAPLPDATGEVAKPTAPVDIPGAAITAGQAVGTDQPAAQPIPIRGTEAKPDTEQQPSRSQPTRDPIAIPSSVPRTKPPSPKPEVSEAEAKPTKQFLPQAEYTQQIPNFLVDLDRYATPEDERFQRATRMTNTLPQPPSLPMFLAKSILNGATPHKDDASVLIMPNHTVLNHLATSSIRSGVLATSGTTRYKRKFLTTIMYRPTSDDG